VTVRVTGTRLDAPKGTHEMVWEFLEQDFQDQSKFEHIATCAAASASFPGLFAPTEVEGALVVDGGLVDNAPISYVSGGHSACLDEVIVVTDYVASDTPRELGGLEYLTRIADIAIYERMMRELDTRGTGGPTVRVLEPSHPLSGSSFAGLGSAALRREYVCAGRERAAQFLNE
jgi:predicted acylesterase/phospholipase RssA